MKVGSAVLGLHISAVCVFALTQGCVTTESQGSGRGAGARQKGPWKQHEHKGVSTEGTAVAQNAPGFTQGIQGTGSIYDPVIIETGTGATVEPYIPPKTTSTAGTQVYIVKKGDILSQIAVDFGTSTKSLIAMNNLTNPDVLYVGQELRVPAGHSSSKVSTTSKSSSSAKKGGEYTIQKGDTLSHIAVAAGVSIDDLRSLNNIKNDKIFAGEKLSIPSYGKVPASTRSTAASTPAVKKATKTEPTPPVAPAPSAVAPAPSAIAPAPTPSYIEPTAPEVAPSLGPVETTNMSVDMVQDHVVYPGETLDDIARTYSVSKSDIMRLNNITDEASIKEGQRLRVPITE